MPDSRVREPEAIGVGDIVQIVGEPGDRAWRGAIGTVESVYEPDGKPNLERVATVCVEDLGTSTFATRLLRRLVDPTTQTGAGASSDAAPTEREAATRSGDAAPAPGKGALSCEQMTTLLRERARRLMMDAAKVHDRIGDGAVILGIRGMHIDLDAIVANVEEIRDLLRRGPPKKGKARGG